MPLQEGTGKPAFTVWDCSEPRGTAAARDPTGEPGERGVVASAVSDAIDQADAAVPDDRANTDDYEWRVRPLEDGTVRHPLYRYPIAVPAVAPSSEAPDGSYADAYHAFMEGIYGCGAWPHLGPFFAVQNPPVESDGAWPAEEKREADFPFFFSRDGGTFVRDFAFVRDNLTSRYPALVRPVLDETGYPPDPHPQLMEAIGDASMSAGVSALRSVQGGGWMSDAPQQSAPAYRGHTVEGDGSPSGPVWITAYARVAGITTPTLILPSGFGVYGAAACEDGGVAARWDCDRDDWWNPALGGREAPRYAPRPGDMYQLRDVDCLDGTLVAGTPARASLVDLSDAGACP